MPNLVRQSIHSFKRNSWGVMRKGTFKNFGEQAKGYSFGTRVCGWTGKRLARASLERKASELAISLDRPNKHKSNSTGSQVQQNGFGPALLHSLLRLVKDTAKPNTRCWLAKEFDSSRWFAISNLSPICSPSFTYWAGLERVMNTQFHSKHSSAQVGP